MTPLPRRAPGWAGVEIFAIGHSTLQDWELLARLLAHGVATLVDVRTVPRSRTNPQFNRERLAKVLPAAGVGYVHVAELGGLRAGLGVRSKNTGWRNKSFRGYADHLATPEFARGLERLREIALQGPACLMCAEALRWRCHRSLIADALYARGVVVQHIVSETRTEPHRLTAFAVLKGRQVTYPGDDAAPLTGGEGR